MRLLFGIVLGVAITVGAAYFRDSSLPVAAPPGAEAAARPMVNWDVVRDRWDNAAARVREEWARWTRA